MMVETEELVEMIWPKLVFCSIVEIGNEATHQLCRAN